MIARALAQTIGWAALAAGALAAAPDRALYTAEMLALRTALSNELAAAEARVRELQADTLRQAQRDWDAELAERRRTRNIRGIAVAEDARAAIQRMLDGLASTGRLEWPTNLRRELNEAFEQLRAKLDAAERRARESAATSEAAAIERFRTAATRAGAQLPPDPEALRSQFHAWLRDPLPAHEPQPAASATAARRTSAAPTGATVADQPPAARPEPPEFFAQSRAGTDWIPIGTWRAESRGPDVFEINVFGAPGERRGEQPNPILGRATTWTWRQEHEVKPGVYSWRLRRLGTSDVVDVVEWPSPANEGRLVFRTRMPQRLPAQTAFEVQYSVAKLIALEIKTDPPGALVEINGQPWRDGLRDVRTPCTVHVPPGTISMKLSLDGYEDAVAPSLRVDSNRVIAVKLAPLKDAPGRTVTVNPQEIWANSGITVKRGDRIRLAVEGEWSCGARGEMTGPQGYDPRDLRFSHYYLDEQGSPKQLDSAPYGALLARIGTNPIVAVGKSAGFIAGADGPLLFDINEKPEPALRRNNRGALKVNVLVQPGGGL